LLSLVLWSRRKQLSNLLPMSAFSFVVMALGFLAFMPDVLAGYPGLKQRFFHVGWSIWFVYLSYGFLKLNKAEMVEKLAVEQHQSPA